MNTPETLVKKIVQEQGTIQDVFLTACGGSLVDLYPGYYFINAESETMHAHWLTAKEMVVSPSKFLKKGALVILCSHGGNTPETVNAAKFAKERGAAIITMTHNPESVCAQEDMNPIVYDWSDETDEKERPQGLVMRILNELLKVQETGYKKYDAILDGLEKADGIVRAAVKKGQNRTWLFAEKYAYESGIPTSFDLNLRVDNGALDPEYEKAVREIIKYTTYLLGSGTDEFIWLGEEKDWRKNALKFVSDTRTVIVRNGKDGSYGFSINEEEKAAAFNVKVEDTVGAGDVYNAGFISARLNGQSLKESLILGNAVSGYTVSRKGARSSPDQTELKRFLRVHQAEVEERR